MKTYRCLTAILCLLLMVALPAAGPRDETPFKIAVAGEGKTPDSPVAHQGGRCRYLLFFDHEGKMLEWIESPFWEQARRAGVRCAHLLGEKGVTNFVAGRVGPKMKNALEDQQIKYLLFQGTVKQAVAKVLEERKKN